MNTVIHRGDQGFPHAALDDCESALVVFCAAFGGSNDARWVRQAGLVATCIDTDADKLDVMARSYPAGWRFLRTDAYQFAAATSEIWDVVTLDPWSNQFQRCADMLDDWCGLARHAVVIGTGPETTVSPPAGWRVTETRHRSDYNGGVFWTVLERA